MFRGEKAGKKNKAPSDPQLNYQFRNHSKPKILCKIYEARNPSLYIKYWKGRSMSGLVSLEKSQVSQMTSDKDWKIRETRHQVSFWVHS